MLDLCKTTLRFIERCFTVVSDNESFNQLDYNLILKIFASSSLLITSEIEVFKVAEIWLNYNIKERRKYAKNILLKVRLHLLSKDTLQQLLDDSTFFKKDHVCIKLLNKILNCQGICFLNTSSVYQKSRYCSQKSFKIVVGSKYSLIPFNSVYCVDVYNLGDIEEYPPMKTDRDFLKVVYVKGDLYVFSCFSVRYKRVMSVDKFSYASKTWSHVVEMYNDRRCFSFCTFMDKVFIFGGNTGGYRTNSCLQFDTSCYTLKEIAKMNEVRSQAACVVFTERMVVSGGIDYNYNTLNTVESYDVLPNKWSPMPSMNYGKFNHSLVVVKNKLFVISQKANTFEVFDNTSKNFVILSPPKLSYSCKVVSIENKIVFLENFQNRLCFYDVDKNEWSEKPCDVTKNLQSFSCVKIPCL